MRTVIVAIIAAAALTPVPGSGQEYEVTRRSYTFIDNRLNVHVLGTAPGELQILRGDRGRIEVAARSSGGFPGFGLGGDVTRELRLTAVGADRVQYLVVVPEHVAVTVRLPGGGGGSLSTFHPSGSYQWGDGARTPIGTQAEVAGALLPTLHNGMYLIHATTWAPSSVDLPELGSVRSLSVRFEGGEFRIAASRPLTFQPGRGAVTLRVNGDPVDIVVSVPRGGGVFQLRSGDAVLAELRGGIPVTRCSGVVVQNPTPQQHWLTFYPEGTRPRC